MNGIDCVKMLYLYKSPGIRPEQLFDLGVLREDLTAPRGVRLVRVRPEEVRRHYPVFSVLFLHFHNHCFLRWIRSLALFAPMAPLKLGRGRGRGRGESASGSMVTCLWIQSVFVLDLCQIKYAVGCTWSTVSENKIPDNNIFLVEKKSG